MASGEGSTLEIRVPGFPTPIKFQDWVHSGYYGTAEYANGDTTELDLFSAGPGAQIPGGGRTMTKVDTNLNKAGINGLDPGYQMLIYSIQLEIKAMGFTQGTAALTDPRCQPNLALWHDVYDKIWWHFDYNGKTVMDGRAHVFPQGKGIYLTTTAAGQEIALNSEPTRQAQVELVLPIWLKSNIGYSFFGLPVVALRVAEAFTYGGVGYSANYFDAQVRIEGLVSRPVR